MSRDWVLGMGAFQEFLTGLCCHRNRCCLLLNHPCSSFYQISMRLPQIDPTVCMLVHSPLLVRFVQLPISPPSIQITFPPVCCSIAYFYSLRYKPSSSYLEYRLKCGNLFKTVTNSNTQRYFITFVKKKCRICVTVSVLTHAYSLNCNYLFWEIKAKKSDTIRHSH